MGRVSEAPVEIAYDPGGMTRLQWAYIVIGLMVAASMLLMVAMPAAR
jgi:hypothetical protein